MYVINNKDNRSSASRQVPEEAIAPDGETTSITVLESPGLHAGGDVVEQLAEQAPEEQPAEKKSKDKKANTAKKQSHTKENQADLLVKIAITEAALFHDEMKEGYANFAVGGHRETCHLKSKYFKIWLVRQFYKTSGKSPSSQALRQALNVIESNAMFDGAEIKLNLRVAEYEDGLWYDLADDKWQAVNISTSGWRVVEKPPVLFRRYKNTAPQVTPVPGGSLDLLKKYINLQDERDWQLLFALLVHAFVPGVPHAVAVFHGDKGSAKTTAQRVMRKLIDPAHRDVMVLPTEKNELALILSTNYAPSFDNLGGLSAWQSDMLCQASTGGGISKRELYTDIDEVILSFLRCVFLNGINVVASKDDLLDRSLLFRFERVEERKRRPESVFWQEYEADRPLILGAIFDALAGALQIQPTVRLPVLPRMADFASWGYAVAEAVSGSGSGNKFMEAYFSNIGKAVEEAIISDTVGAALAGFMQNKNTWEGTATELWELLSDLPGVKKNNGWPKGANVLTRRLNDLKSAFSDFGININSDNRSRFERKIIISKRGK